MIALALALAAVPAGAAPPGHVVARIKIGLNPCAEVQAFGAVWVANASSNTLSRINPATNRVTATVKVGPQPCALVPAAGALWVDGYGWGEVERVDPRRLKVTRRISVGSGVWDVAFDGRFLWADSNGDGTVVKIDPRTSRIVTRLRIGGSPTGLEVADGSLWVGSNGPGDRRFFRIDLATRRVTRIDAACARPAYFASAPGAVWVMCVGDTTVLRIDPATNAIVARVEAGPQPGDGTVGADGLVWVPLRGAAKVARIDPATNAVVDTIAVSGTPMLLNVAFGDVWVPDYRGSTIWRLTP